MAGRGDGGLPLVDESRMLTDLLVLEEDLNAVHAFVDLHFFADKTFRHRIAVRVDMDVALHIDGAIEGQIDRRDIGGKRREVRFFHEEGSLRAHAERALDLLIRHLLAPPLCLRIEIVPIGEAAAGEEVMLDVRKVSFDSCLPVSIADGVRNEPDGEDCTEALHLRGNIRIGTCAVGDDDARIVDDAAGTGAVHEPEGRIEKGPRLEAGKGGIVLDEEFSGVGKDEPCALGFDLFLPKDYLVGRGVVLHLLTRAKGIGTDANVTILPEVEVSDDPRERAVGNRVAALLQDLLHPDHIAPGAFEQLTHQGEELIVARSPLRPGVPCSPDHPPDGGPGTVEDAADLAQVHTPLVQTQNRLLILLGKHHTS